MELKAGVSICPLFAYSLIYKYENLTLTLDCYAVADTDMFTAAKKVHIDRNLWDEDEVDKYIKEISPATASWDASQVLRFGICGADDELLIPKDMLGAPIRAQGGGPLGLYVHCYGSLKALKAAMDKENLGKAPTVDYTTFNKEQKAARKLKTREDRTCQIQ